MMEWALSLAVLIVIVTVLRRALRGHVSLRVQYALWALVLVRALVPFSLFSSPLSVMNAADKVPAVSAVQTVRGYDALEYSPATGTVEGFRGYDYMRDAPETVAENSSGADFRRLETALTARELLLRVWAGGAVLVLAVFAVSRLRFSERLRKSRRELDVPGSIIPVYVSDAVETPCLFGLFSPAVYLTPESAAENPAALRHVLAHETTHYRHGDNIWSALRCLCLALHWYDPLMWLAAELSRRDGELACDEGAIKRLGEAERAEYGRTLIALTVQRPAAFLRPGTTMASSARSLRERIGFIAKKPKNAAIAVAAAVLVGALAVGCTFSGAKAEETPSPFEPASASITLVPDGDTASFGADTAKTLYAAYLDARLLDAASEPAESEHLSVKFAADDGSGLGFELWSDGTARFDGASCVRLDGGVRLYRLLSGYYGAAQRENSSYFDGYDWESYASPATAEQIDPEAPESVTAAVNEYAVLALDGYQLDFPEYQLKNFRIQSIQKAYFYPELGGRSVDVWCVNVEYLSAAPEKLMLAGGMYVTTEGWACMDYPNSRFVLTDAETGEYRGMFFSNDVFPGSAEFEDLALSQLSLEGTVEEASSYMTVGENASFPVLARPGRTVYADLDGDGENEAIDLTVKSGSFGLEIDGVTCVLGAYGEGPDDRCFAITDIDAADGLLEVAVGFTGESGNDYTTGFFRWDGAQPEYLGAVNGLVGYEQFGTGYMRFDGAGGVYSYIRFGLLHTWWGRAQWTLENGALRFVEQPVYDACTPTEVTALAEISVYSAPDTASAKTTLPAGTVITLTGSDNESWVRLTADGEEKWLRIENGTELESAGRLQYCGDALDGLNMAG